MFMVTHRIRTDENIILELQIDILLIVRVVDLGRVTSVNPFPSAEG